MAPRLRGVARYAGRDIIAGALKPAYAGYPASQGAINTPAYAGRLVVERGGRTNDGVRN
ncbi:MAG: hypothetical protein RR837_10120 [Bacteroidales bacterium]